MKKIVLTVLALYVVMLASCAIFTPKNVKGALDVAHAACVLFHDDIEDVAILAKACGIHEDLWPDVRDLVAARKQAAARKAAMAAPSASGAVK